MKHSTVVGGSTAKRVMNCPGSVALVAKMPPQPSSTYADKGTLLHNVISEVLDQNVAPHSLVGTTYAEHMLDEDMLDEKIFPALAALDVIDPDKQMEFAVETSVNFGKWLPDAFGSADFLGRIGSKAVVLDWKFGDGVAVDAEDNEQLMFYAAAAMRSPEAAWVFDGATEIELIIVQPPVTRRWVTTPKRIRSFELSLKRAVKAAAAPDAALKAGDHCRFCPAKPTCPVMTGAVDRATKVKLDALDNDLLGVYASNAVLLQGWIDDLHALVRTKIEKGATIPGWKIVAKRGTRKWADAGEAATGLAPVLGDSMWKPIELISPAQAEKLLKKEKKELPADLVVSVSSGDTLAPESDPRPAVLQIGQQLTAALSKLV
jgi:hypothetical protein